MCCAPRASYLDAALRIAILRVAPGVAHQGGVVDQAPVAGRASRRGGGRGRRLAVGARGVGGRAGEARPLSNTQRETDLVVLALVRLGEELRAAPKLGAVARVVVVLLRGEVLEIIVLAAAAAAALEERGAVDGLEPGRRRCRLGSHRAGIRMKNRNL